jgi:hypothetical protein
LRSIVKNLFVVLLVIAGFSRSAAAGTVSLTWSPSPDSTVIGYKIYYGTASQVYSTNVVVGIVTSLTLPGLTNGTTYYFAATSFDGEGDESAYSSEVSFTVMPDPIPALITQPACANGQFSFNVAGVAGSQYVVQASTDMINWVTLVTNTSPFSFADPNAGAFPNRFYRASPAQ